MKVSAGEWLHLPETGLAAFVPVFVVILFVLFFSEMMDSCAKSNGGCSQLCEKVNGKIQCFCIDGYKLATDGKTCLGRIEFATSHHSAITLLKLKTISDKLQTMPTTFGNLRQF